MLQATDTHYQFLSLYFKNELRQILIRSPVWRLAKTQSKSPSFPAEKTVFYLSSYPPSVQSEGGMSSVITHPFALEREMREQCHAQPRTHCFCAHAHEKQGCVMNHLQRKTVEQVNKQDMKCKEPTTERKKESTKKQWSQVHRVN